MTEPHTPHLIVDTHVHVASTDRERYPIAQQTDLGDNWIVDRPLPVERLLADMDAAGVAKAVVVQPGAMLSDNGYVTDSARQHPNRVVAVCVVDDFAPDAGEKLEYWVRERGASGLRLSVVARDNASDWLTDPGLDPLWLAVERLAVPVCVHVRWDGLPNLRKVLDRRSRVAIALDHLAHPALEDGPPFDSVQPLLDLASCPNLYLKISTWSLATLAGQPAGPAPFIELLVQRFGARRLAWGSNAPRSQGPYRDLVELARDAVSSLSQEEASWLLGRTAMSLYPGLGASSG